MIAFLLAIGGVVTLFVGASRHRSAPPRPPASAAGRIVAPSQPATSTTRSSTRHRSQTHRATVAPPRAVLGFSPPAEITIPKIGVHSVLVRLDRNLDGTVQVPSSFHVAGWYEHSVTPGQVGPSVILGHVDSASGPGIFYRLGTLRPGDRVVMKRLDGRSATFVITGVREYAKDSFPTLEVYGNTAGPTLRLVTCGGAFDRASGHYVSNIIAYGELAA